MLKLKNRVVSVIIAVIHSKWKRPALMTLAILTAVVAGCDGCHKH